MEKVSLSLEERSRNYDILIGDDLIPRTGILFKEYHLNGRVVIVTNPTVARWYLQPVTTALEETGYDVRFIQIPDGEEYKNIEEAYKIYDFLIEGRYDRKTILVALGGGVVGDLTGFVAATYMRGVTLVQIPTTLLAQVDSSIGGKVAVNHPKGKNLIGAFYQPRLVITDVTTLATLPPRELGSGMAEVIKHGIILDEHYFDLVTGELDLVRQVNPAFMAFVVAGSCNIKADVVQNDETETGMRAILNFGHTIGHSLESLTHYTRFKHGEAVMIGMLAALRIAVKIGLLPDNHIYESLENTIHTLDMPSRIPQLPVEAIYQSLFNDKKTEFSKIRWILPCRLGETVIRDDVPESVVKEVLAEMGAI